jgi:MFS transporter, OPA family, solute carrier family 37 (glycerol-3-phosphate transporter), member 3
MNSIYLTIVGLFIGDASNKIAGRISAYLGRKDAIQGNSEALATVTGIVDGTGSVGSTVLTQIVCR